MSQFKPLLCLLLATFCLAFTQKAEATCYFNYFDNCVAASACEDYCGNGDNNCRRQGIRADPLSVIHSYISVSAAYDLISPNPVVDCYTGWSCKKGTLTCPSDSSLKVCVDWLYLGTVTRSIQKADVDNPCP